MTSFNQALYEVFGEEKAKAFPPEVLDLLHDFWSRAVEESLDQEHTCNRYIPEVGPAGPDHCDACKLFERD